MRTGESGLVDGGNLTLREMEYEKGKVFPGDDASSGEPGEGVGQSVGLERHGTVHDVEMEVRRIGVARIADLREHLAGHDLVARLDPQAARLEMGVECKAF